MGEPNLKFIPKNPKSPICTTPDFDTQPHPTLHTAMQIDLRDLQVHYFDGEASDNPPILHCKEKLVTPTTRTTKSLPNSPNKRRIGDCSTILGRSLAIVAGKNACANTVPNFAAIESIGAKMPIPTKSESCAPPVVVGKLVRSNRSRTITLEVSVETRSTLRSKLSNRSADGPSRSRSPSSLKVQIKFHG